MRSVPLRGSRMPESRVGAFIENCGSGEPGLPAGASPLPGAGYRRGAAALRFPSHITALRISLFACRLRKWTKAASPACGRNRCRYAPC